MCRRKGSLKNGNLKAYCPGRLKGDVQDHANILDLRPCQILQDGDKVKQLVVVRVREPAADGYRVLGMEDVGRRGVVDNNGFSEVPSDLGKVLHDSSESVIAPRSNDTDLHIIPLVIVTALSE